MSTYKMRELPMRRGLSPEGRAIRERHQSSITFGLSPSTVNTSTTDASPKGPTLQSRCSKDEALQLRRIQAKCRQSNAGGEDPHTLHQPLRATHPLPGGHTQSDLISGAGMTSSLPSVAAMKGRERDGSAHSDYFSLPDEQQHRDEQDDPTARGPSPHILTPATLHTKPLSTSQRHSLTEHRDIHSSGNTGSNDSGSKDGIGMNPVATGHVDYDQELNSDSQGDVLEYTTKFNHSNSYDHEVGCSDERANVSANGVVLRGSSYEANIRSVTNDALAVVGENIGRLQQVQKYKNQELSADNPLFLGRGSSSNDYCSWDHVVRGRTSVPSSTRLKPPPGSELSLTSETGRPPARNRLLPANGLTAHDQPNSQSSRQIINDRIVVSTSEEHLLGADADGKPSAVVHVTSSKQGNIRGSISSLDDQAFQPNELNKCDRPQAKYPVGDGTEFLPDAGDTHTAHLTSLRRGHQSPARIPTSLPGSDTSIPAAHVEEGGTGYNNFSQTYTLPKGENSLTNTFHKPHKNSLSRENIFYDYSMSRNNSLEDTNISNLKLMSKIAGSNQRDFCTNEYNGVSLRSSGGSPVEASPTHSARAAARVHNTVAATDAHHPPSGIDSSLRHSLTIDGHSPCKDSLMSKLQSGSSSKLMPATFPKPSEFTRSLRSNATYNRRSCSSQARPVKACELPASMRGNSENSSVSAEMIPVMISQELRSNKVPDILAKIKENKPTCDVDYKHAKRSIQRQHVSLFGRGDVAPSDGAASSRLSVGSDVSCSTRRRHRTASVDRGLRTRSVSDTSKQTNAIRGRSPAPRSSVNRTTSCVAQSPSRINNTSSNKEFSSDISRSKSNVDLTLISKTKNNSYSSQVVPHINLKDIDQNSLNESFNKVHNDSSSSYNFRHPADNPSHDNIKLPLDLPRVVTDACSSRTELFVPQNTLELNTRFSERPHDWRKNPTTTAATLSNASNSYRSTDALQHGMNSSDTGHGPQDDCSAQDRAGDRGPFMDRVVEESSRQSSALHGGAAPSTSHEDVLCTSTPRLDDAPQLQHQPACSSRQQVDAAPVPAAPTKGARQRADCQRVEGGSRSSMGGEPPPTYKRGQVPKYLRARRAEEARKQELQAAQDPACPAHHTPLSEQQRLATLTLLHHSVKEVLQEIGGLPVAQDTLRSRRHRQQLELKLEQLEDGINIFSQPKVYVLNDEEE